MLANASNAIIVGFNVRPDPVAKQNAEQSGVDIRLYRIIYDAIEEITDAMKGMLVPKYREVETARIEVRQVYKISNVGTVAGSYVLDGKVGRNNEIRVVRDGIVIAEDKMSRKLPQALSAVSLLKSSPISRRATFSRRSIWKNTEIDNDAYGTDSRPVRAYLSRR